MADNNPISLNYQSDADHRDNHEELSINITVNSDSDPSTIRLRKERFSTPVTVLISTSTTAQNNRISHLSNHDGRDFVPAYSKYACYKFLTTVHIIEEAVSGIIAEDTKIGKRHQAEQSAEQLRNVKHFGENSNSINNIPSQIG